ncbi:DMT family transporter [Isobaculum melis]|uniref:Paired small multidrug resistance pump n=1 Tax=Isobaculum melis TaxID=142588 RepID=A0A1H9TLF7_9LACT|nr:multidrug efflux SMR transporter [Isobaculum melis]SER98025.1 paired small multidrug resistance pump [Isobaculum melis]
MSWIYLLIAGFFEILGVGSISRYNQKKDSLSLLILILMFGCSFLFLQLAMRVLPMGMSYAIWTGIGTSGGALLGMLFFKESKDWRRLLCIALVLGAVIGLKLVG